MHSTNLFSLLFAVTSTTYAYPTFTSLGALPRLSPRALDKSGTMTFFTPASSASSPSACGTTNSPSDAIVALSSSEFSADKCGKSITIQANGKTATATVGDRCGGTCGAEDIDVTESVFGQIASTDVGRVEVTWGFN